MKKFASIILIVFTFLSVANAQLKVGQKAPDWTFTDASKKSFTMNSWDGKVLQINYVDPDVSDINDPLNEAIEHAHDVDKTIGDQFMGFGIVDCKSTWKPDILIRKIAGNKAKKFGTTILFDYDATLQKLWGLPKNSYSVVILDKNRICRAIYKGEVPESKFDEIIKLISDLEKE